MGEFVKKIITEKLIALFLVINMCMMSLPYSCAEVNARAYTHPNFLGTWVLSTYGDDGSRHTYVLVIEENEKNYLVEISYGGKNPRAKIHVGEASIGEEVALCFFDDYKLQIYCYGVIIDGRDGLNKLYVKFYRDQEFSDPMLFTQVTDMMPVE